MNPKQQCILQAIYDTPIRSGVVWRDEDPDKPFSGVFSVRMPPELHRKIYLEARRLDKSLNSWVRETLSSATEL